MDLCLQRQQYLTLGANLCLSLGLARTILLDGIQKESLYVWQALAFWDYSEKKKLGGTEAELSVTSEWSPDGQYFMTATTAPRLQVDNGIKIFDHNGSLFFKRMYDKLFQVDWKPESPDKFGDIEEVLKSLDTLKLEDTTKQGQGLKSAQQKNLLLIARQVLGQQLQFRRSCLEEALLEN